MIYNIIFVVVFILFISGCGSSDDQVNNDLPEMNSSDLVTTDNPQEQEQEQEQNNSQPETLNLSPTNASIISEKWHLVWQDEFDSNTIDFTKWQFEVNCYGGGNDEQQCYTDRPDNAYIEEGVLNITAVKESFSGPKAQDDDSTYNNTDLKTLPYTSARLRTKYQGDWTYGRFEIRAKLPFGQGTWPAIWMLPTDWAYRGWAGSGEIDIMEAVNLKTLSDEIDALPEQSETRVHGTLHYGSAWPDNVYSGTAFNLPNGLNPADDFHEYAIEWQEGEIRWYVDDIHFATQRESGWYSHYMSDQGQLVAGDNSAPFDQKFHLIMNLAVGGNWATNVNEQGIDESVFPQTLLIDYVRVYECSISPANGKGCEAIGENAELVEGHQAPSL
jgi:beta-glucanase (GH16 family)